MTEQSKAISLPGNMMPASSARKLIYPGTVKSVHVRFVPFGHDDGHDGLVRVPKSEARRMLRDLRPGSLVRLALLKDGVAIISGRADD